MTDWEALTSTAERPWDKQEIKDELPIEWVLDKYGIILEPAGDGRLVGRCPFHGDENASFAVWREDNGTRRVGCWVCQDFRVEDVFGFLSRYHSEPDFQRVGEIAGELLREFRLDSEWAPTFEPVAAHRADPNDLLAHCTESLHRHAEQNTPNAGDITSDEKGWGFDGRFLIDDWLVGVEQDGYTLTIPHWRYDAVDGWAVTGMKTRTARSKTIARAGSDLSALYGEWRDQMRQTVVLCEGESDAWTADWVIKRAGLDWDVLALPSGVSAAPRPEWQTRLSNRVVILAFDGDDAGRAGLRKWANALVNRALSVKIATMPDGQDLSSLPDALEPLANAVAPHRNPGVVAADAGGFVRMGGNAPVPLTGWSIEPVRVLTTDNGRLAFEVKLPNGDHDVVTPEDLSSEKSFRDWSTAHVNGTYRGTTKDAQDILSLFEADAPYMPQGRATSVIGWHDGAFITPDRIIAPEHQHWSYLPPKAGITDLEEKFDLFVPGNPDLHATLAGLLGFRSPEVMTPLIAWLALAPLRPLFKQFPVLAVTGSAGCGKTSTIEAVLRTFGWRLHSTLTSTTPHAVHSFVGLTNGVPMWFDEYRNAAREDAKMALDQALRDAWEGSSSYKGGMQENKMALTALPATAPIIVSGEDAFVETSHAERLIQVQLSRRDLNPDGLRRLRDANTAGFGYEYVQWLVNTYWDGGLPIRVPDLSYGRVEYNLSCMEVGWELFDSFARLHCGFAWPEPEWAQVRANVLAAAAHDPYAEVVRWGMQEMSGDTQLVTPYGDGYAVRVASLYAAATRTHAFKLPGAAKAMERHLIDSFGGYATCLTGLGDVVVIPRDSI